MKSYEIIHPYIGKIKIWVKMAKEYLSLLKQISYFKSIIMKHNYTIVLKILLNFFF